MRHWILDFVFDLQSGQSRLVIDYDDHSLTALEINSMIQVGEVREEVMTLAGQIFGAELEARLRSGELPLVCLDDQPDQATAAAPARAQVQEQAQIQDQALLEGQGG